MCRLAIYEVGARACSLNTNWYECPACFVCDLRITDTNERTRATTMAMIIDLLLLLRIHSNVDDLFMLL